MELEDLMITAAALLGFVSLFKSLLVFTRWIHATFLRKPKNLREYGSWTVVTGPTDGIGKALAFELASKGLNIVLVGRNPSKLEATSSELTQRYGNEIQVKTVVADLAKLSGLEIQAAVASATEGLDVGVVVNNAGAAQGHPFAKYFHEVDDETMENILRVNVNAAVWVTKGTIGGMLKKKRGAIVNIGSGSTVYVSSFPLQTMYASTKAFMAMFSKSVALEYKDQGIDIQCQVPLFTATKMTMFKQRAICVPSADMFSRASVRWIGYDRQCNPYWSHAVQGFIFHTFDTISVWYLEYYMKWMRKKDLQQDRNL